MSDQMFVEDSETPEIDPTKNYREELVGEGKKFATDEDLARGKAESDLFIARLAKENKELRERNQTLPSLQSLIDKLQAERTTTEPSREDTTPPEGITAANPQPVEIEALVEKVLAERSSKSKQADNLSQVREVLEQSFGPGWQQVAVNRAKELGVGAKFLDDLAKEQPKAVFAILGVKETIRPVNPVPGTRTNPGSVKGEKKNFNYFEKIRRSDPDKYNSLAMHNEMLTQLAEQGDDFYS